MTTVLIPVCHLDFELSRTDLHTVTQSWNLGLQSWRHAMSKGRVGLPYGFHMSPSFVLRPPDSKTDAYSYLKQNNKKKEHNYDHLQAVWLLLGQLDDELP